MKKHLILAAATLAFALPALAGAKPPADTGPAEATIPFADRNGIDDFQAFDEHSVYLRARDGQWYYAQVLGFCPGLDKKPNIAYETNPDGTFDRLSTLKVNGRSCQLTSVVESNGPPSRSNKAKG